MASKRKKTYLIGLAVTIVLPLFSLILVNQLSKNSVKIPKHYGLLSVDTLIDPDGNRILDSVYRTVSELSLYNQLGNRVLLNRDLKGKILVLNLFETKDSLIGPVLSGTMEMLRESYKKNADWVQFISLSLDPKADSVMAIRHYADRFHANHDYWWLLTGDSASIFQYVQEDLNISSEQLAHKESQVFNQFILIDTFRKVRGYFDGLDTLEIRNLADDITILTMEKVKKK